MSNLSDKRLNTPPVVSNSDGVLVQKSDGTIEKITNLDCTGKYIGKDRTTGKIGKRQPILLKSARFVAFSLAQTAITHQFSTGVNKFTTDAPIVINNIYDCEIHLDALVSSGVSYSSADIGVGNELDSRWDLGPQLTLTGGATASQELSGQFPSAFFKPQATGSTYYQIGTWRVLADLPIGASITLSHYYDSRHLLNSNGAATITYARTHTKQYKLYSF